MKTHKINTTFGLPEKDIQLISDIVNVYSGTNYNEATRMLRKVFCQDIKNEHYSMLGFLIGNYTATENAVKNQNNFFLCLKQN